MKLEDLNYHYFRTDEFAIRGIISKLGLFLWFKAVLTVKTGKNSTIRENEFYLK